MTENDALLKRRDELTLALSEGHYKTLVDVILEWVNQPFKKMMGNNRTVSFIYGMFAIYFLTALIGIIVVAVAGEFDKLNQLASRFSWWFFLSFMTATLSMTGANIFIHRIIAVFRDDILQIAETVETLDDIEKWVDFVCNTKLALLLGVLGSAAASAVVLLNLNTLVGFFVGIGFYVTFILFSMQSSLFVFFLYAILFLTVRMRRYQLILFSSDPSISQIIKNLSDLMSSFVYLFAIYGAALTFGVISIGLLSSFYQILPMFWVLIVLIFAINQYSLAQIIQREKWKTLNSVQAKIEEIQKEQAVPDKETRETLNWLLDYHSRVKATRNSALDLEAGFNLFNSLLLPVFAFVLGNLDKVIAFFR